MKTLRFVALAMVLSASGCYRYRPAELAAVPPGEYVRLYVTREALSELSGSSSVESPVLTGRLVRAEPGSLLVRLPVAAREQGFSTQILGQDIAVPRDQILQFQRREINRPATALMTVGGTAIITGVAILIIDGARQGGLPPGSDGVEQFAPRIRIPFP